jgi:beta-glucosidase
MLAAGASETVRVTIDPRLLAEWREGRWSIKPGVYQFALGRNAEDLGTPVPVRLSGRHWKD